MITQGDTKDLALAEILGVGTITGLPAGDVDGQPVTVTLEFDENGRLHVHATFVPTGHSLELDLAVQGGLKEEQVREFRNLLVSTGTIDKPKSPDVAKEVKKTKSQSHPVVHPKSPSRPAGPAPKPISTKELLAALDEAEEDADDDLPPLIDIVD